MKIVGNLLSTADKIDHGVLTFKTTKVKGEMKVISDKYSGKCKK